MKRNGRIPSRFLIELPFTWKERSFLILFHTLNRGLKLVDREVWEHCKKGNGHPDTADIYDELCREDFLIDSTLDETRLLQTWRLGRFHSTRELAFKIKVTEECNLRCDFCIQAGGRPSPPMSEETAYRCVQFIEGEIRRHRPRSVHLLFTGGEPLLNLKAVRAFQGIHHLCEGSGIDCTGTIATNGTLLTRAVTRELSRLGVQRVRVSLFGPPRIHDRHRPLQGGNGSYEIIEHNLLEAAEFARLCIACQYDEHTEEYREYPELFARLASLGLASSIEEVELGPLLPRELPEDGRFPQGCTTCSRPDIFCFLEEQARAHGLSRLGDPPSHGCLANYRSRHVIDPDGNLVSCPGVTHDRHPELTYGNVYRGVDFVRQSQIVPHGVPDACLECPLAGVCEGGCRQQALVQYGDFNHLDCKREYLEPVLHRYLENRVRAFLEEQEPVPAPRA